MIQNYTVMPELIFSAFCAILSLIAITRILLESSTNKHSFNTVYLMDKLDKLRSFYNVNKYRSYRL